MTEQKTIELKVFDKTVELELLPMDERIKEALKYLDAPKFIETDKKTPSIVDAIAAQLIRDMQARIRELKEEQDDSDVLIESLITERKNVEAENARLRESQEWQNISAAPKDGSYIDVYHFQRGRIPDAKWCQPELNRNKKELCWCEYINDDCLGWIPIKINPQPLYFMPLPQPPKDIES